ncbi:ABC transporter substrate-binding protein [Terrisporobacter petrolearius]|uniref:ABC transporter substrate-binding protein n=1 Tax=Terrisporobacter petrolearius TaxID=1460447 RepID=UPI0031CC7FEA
MKKRLLAIITSFVLMFAVGCSSNKETTVTDREGNEVKVPTKLERIISAVPSNTEVLVELGLADKLVGVDKYSEGIEGLNKDIPKMDMNNPDAEAIIALEPDIIIASGHNKIGSAEDPYKAIVEAGIPVVYIPSSDSIKGIYKDIEFIASLVNEKKKGEEIITDMKAKISKYEELGKTIKDKKKVYFEIGPAPSLFTFGNSTFLNEMIEVIGAENVFKNEKSWFAPTEEAILDSNPDAIFTNVSYVKNPTKEISSRNGWENIKAIKKGDVYYIDSNSSARGNQNIIKALDEMAKAIYPDVYGK